MIPSVPPTEIPSPLPTVPDDAAPNNAAPDDAALDAVTPDALDPDALDPDAADFATDPQSQIPEDDLLSLTVTPLAGRRRQIIAQILIPCGVDTLWAVLTDYEQLATFIPNLEESCILGHEEGCTLVKQVGKQQFLLLKFAAAVTLKIRERYPDALEFEMVKGDFLEFAGAWELAAMPTGTQLTYRLTILPPRHMPLQLVERCLKHDLAANLRAIRDFSLAQTATP